MTGELPNDATRDFILAHRKEDVRSLALKHAAGNVDLRMALQQIEGWQTAVRKLPSWAATAGVLYPPRLSMEQCSSEATARYKQSVVRRWMDKPVRHASTTLADLTGGFGIDFSFLAPLFDRAIYMERQPCLCRIAGHNFRLLGLKHAEILETDSSLRPETWPEMDCCFVDPARRDKAGRKTVALEDCEPDLGSLQKAIRDKADFCMAKLSPMLDIPTALRTLAHTAEVHAVSVQGECKELLWVITRETPRDVTFHCVNLGTADPDFVFRQEEEAAATCWHAARPGKYLYEPNPSVMKCGGFRCVASRYGLLKLHPNTHLYTSDTLHAEFPGRVFTVETCTHFNKKELKTLLQDLPQANLTVRNFPETVERLRKRLKLKEGGEAYLFATTLADGGHVLLRCRKADKHPHKDISPPPQQSPCH